MEIHQLVFSASSPAFDPIGIVKTVAASILEVFLLCIAGYILSVKGIIDSKSKNTLNKINVSFFTPALMFSKVAFSLTSEKLVDLYVVPLSFVIITFTSLTIAWVLSKLFGFRRAERNFCLSFAMFMNSNSLPIALMTSLITTIHGRDGLKWGADDSKDKQLGRSLTYLVMFSTMGLIFRWSVGVKLLSAAVGEGDRPTSQREELEAGAGAADETTPFVAGVDGSTPKLSVETDRQSVRLAASEQLYSPRQMVSTGSTLSRTRTISSQLSFNSTQGSSLAQPPNARLPIPALDLPNQDIQPALKRPIFHSFPNFREYYSRSLSSKRHSIATSCTTYDDDEASVAADSELDALLSPVELRQRRTRAWKARLHHWIKQIKKLFKVVILRPLLRINRFMTPPLYAAFISLFVVALPSLQQYLEKLHPLRSALKSAGNVSVPLTLVVLGAYFNTSEAAGRRKSSTSAEEGSEGELRPEQKRDPGGEQPQRRERLTILAAIVSRMVLTPLVLIPVLFVVLRYLHTHGPGEEWRDADRFHEDPCFILVTVLLIGAPPAITLAQMSSSNPFPPGSKAHQAQIQHNSRFETLVSKTLFIAYALVTPPATITLVVLGLLIEAHR